MTTERSEKQRRRASSRKRRAEGVSRLQATVLVFILGLYMGLFGLLPRLDAWRKGNTQNDNKSSSEAGQNAKVWVAPSGFPLTPPTPAQLQVPDLPPLAVTLEPLAVVTPLPLAGTAATGIVAQPSGNTTTGTASVAVQPQSLPALPPVEIQPLPILAPLPQVAAPVVRSKGS